jgi:hypothetical protein
MLQFIKDYKQHRTIQVLIWKMMYSMQVTQGTTPQSEVRKNSLASVGIFLGASAPPLGSASFLKSFTWSVLLSPVADSPELLVSGVVPLK